MNTRDSDIAPEHLRQRACQQMQAGQLSAARSTLEALLEGDSGDASAHVDLAGVLLRQGHLREATRHLLQAAALPVDAVGLLIPLIRSLYLTGEIAAARACLQRLEQLPDAPASLLTTRAQLRWMLGEVPAALAWIDQAAAKGVDTPDAYYLHAMLLQFSGAIDRAESQLEACLMRWPGFADAAIALSNLRRQTPGSQHVDRLRAQRERWPSDASNPTERQLRATFESALFKELDDLGRHAEAWEALAHSNAIMHALQPYDADAETGVIDAIIHASDRIGIAGGDGKPTRDGPTPIFIVGMTRSGTTLLERMLGSHSQVVSAGEINDFRRQLRWMTDVPPSGLQGMLKVLERSANIDFAELGARYLQQTQWRAQGNEYYIDKLPINVRMVPFIRRALPRASILHMRREPMDVCFSNLKAMLGNASAFSYDMHSLAHYHAQYMRMIQHWHASMPGAMLDVSYADLVSDPEATVRKVLEYCGLAMEDACAQPELNAAPVATPSSAQVREPIHTRNLGEWEKYAVQLEPLRKALNDSVQT